jgi:hypothetical protein
MSASSSESGKMTNASATMEKSGWVEMLTPQRKTGMTYFITELENTKARLIVSETRTTSEAFADMVIAAIKAKGNLPIFRGEG